MTIRYAFCSAPAISGTRGSAGKPGCPGPPVRSSRTPRGAFVLSAVATASASVPGRRPEWSSGTVSVEHVNPGAFAQAWAVVNAERAAEAPPKTATREPATATEAKRMGERCRLPQGEPD